MDSFAGKIIIALTGLLIGGLLFGTVDVYCAVNGKRIQDEKSLLGVEIKRNDGVSITPRENEVISTNVPIVFRANPVSRTYDYGEILGKEENGSLRELFNRSVKLMYSIKDGGGNTVLDWTECSAGPVTIVPGIMPDGLYTIQFRQIDGLELKQGSVTEPLLPQEPEPISNEGTAVLSANSVSGNVLSEDEKDVHEKLRAEYEKQKAEYEIQKAEYEVKKAEYELLREDTDTIIKEAGSLETDSSVYYLMLDTKVPELDIFTNRNPEEWDNEPVKLAMRINDTESKPARLKVSLGSELLTDEKYDGNSSYSGFEKELVIDGETEDADGSELIIQVADNAGNIRTERRTVRIDKTAPVIGLEGAEDGGVYKKPVHISVAGEDIRPGAVSVGYTIKRVYNGSEETVKSSACTLEEIKREPLFCDMEDGKYTVECSASDNAGNSSSTVRLSFKVDTQAPGLSFAGIVDGALLRGDGVLKINAFDNFEDGYFVTLDGSVDSGTGTKNLKLAEYKTEGRLSTNTYYFKADGDYTVNAMIEDSAGNKYEDSISFTVDRTAPTVEMLNGLNIKDDMITNVAPTLGFRIKEDNYTSATVTCELYRTNDKGKKELVRTPEWVMKEKSSDFSITIDEEGIYELNVKVTDRAGNSAGKSVKFVLDTTGPEIDYVDNLDRKYIKSFKLPDNFSEYIKDNNGVNYQTYLNSMNYDEGSEVNEEGKYVLKVSAVDDAGNQAEKTIEFIVDSTSPRVVIDGMADDGSVNKDDTLVLSLYDQEDYFTSVKLNGEEMVTEDKQQTVALTIPEYGDYTIDVTASDMAENVLTQSIECKCTNSAPVSKGTSTMRTLKQNEKSGTNKGLRIFLIIMTVLILAGSIGVYCYYTVKQERMYQ